MSDLSPAPTNEAKGPLSPDELRRIRLRKLQSMTIMATGIAHDFNNHLAAILGNNNVILRTLPPEGRARDCVQRIEAAANLALHLSDQLAIFASRVACDLAVFDSQQLFDEVRHFIGTTFSHGPRITFNVTPDCPALNADPNLLRRALVNLITNGIESMIERTGGIRVEAGPYHRAGSDTDHAFFELGSIPGWVALTVSDDGCGIAPKIQPLIFDPFLSTKIRGRGMGLPEALGIARLHGGNVIVDSRLGVGTTVKLLLPPDPPSL